ncbi:MAG: nucleotidyltransferase [Chloroflexota bacterium]|nr:nucleotidyltransferase [Chloroflexota bacterium]
MATLNQHFDKMASNLNPPQERRDAARDVPRIVRDYLQGCTSFPTVDPHTRLAGSYAQDMSAGDIKDVDVLVRVDGDPEANEPCARQTIKDLKAALDGLKNSDDGLGGWLVSDVTVNEARRSVHVHFKDKDFHLDIVPFIAPGGLDEPLYVPDKGYDEWIESHPLGVVELVSELDKDNMRKVRKLGKIFKLWRNTTMINMKPKSYWLTALLLQHVQETLDMNKQLPDLFRDLLANIYDQFADHLESKKDAPAIDDPMLGHNVAHNWDRNHFESFMRHLEEGRKQMDRALKAVADGDLDGAVATCQEKLFGDEYFPSDIEDDVQRKAAAFMPGSTYILPGGSMTATKPTTSHIPVQPTRYYGGSDE